MTGINEFMTYLSLNGSATLTYYKSVAARIWFTSNRII